MKDNEMESYNGKNVNRRETDVQANVELERTPMGGAIRHHKISQKTI